jgi:hypothetical protein
MGSSAKSSSASTSSEQTDSLNTTVTTALSGNQDLGLNYNSTGAGNNSFGDLSYNYDSGNTSTNNNLGANSTSDASSNPSGSTLADIPWSEIIVYIIGGLVLFFILRSFGASRAEAGG